MSWTHLGSFWRCFAALYLSRMRRTAPSLAPRCLAWALQHDRQQQGLCALSLLTHEAQHPPYPSPLQRSRMHPAPPAWGACMPMHLPTRRAWVSSSAAAAGSSVVSFPLAQTGEGISECELIQWYIQEGDTVAEFGKLCEVQSDKATIEITSRYAGRVVKVHHAKGDIVKVGASLVDIEVADGAAADAASAGATASAAGPKPSGASPEPPEPLLASAGPTTPKVSPAAASALSGAPTGGPAAAGSQPSTARGPSDRSSGATGGSSNGSSGNGGSRGSGPVLSSPATRHLAREHGVPLAAVQGTGEGGRVVKEDVLRYIEQQQPGKSAAIAASMRIEDISAAEAAVAQAAAAAAVESMPPAAVASTAQFVPGVTTTVPLRGFKRAMVKSMTAVASIPHFHYTDEVCVDALLAVRASLAADPSRHGTKLTMLPLAIKALSVALSQHPHINASLAPSGTDLLVHADHNIGVAMAAPGGLVVPNIKQVQRLSVAEVADELQRLTGQAAANQLATADVTGGTISISNIGTIGGLHATPLVNPPESAIVALGRVQKLPRYNEAGQLVPRSLLPVSWGADHRVVDGAGLARLSNSWKALLEDPTKLLLSLR